MTAQVHFWFYFMYGFQQVFIAGMVAIYDYVKNSKSRAVCNQQIGIGRNAFPVAVDVCAAVPVKCPSRRNKV
jgi:hypothetical protein